MVVYDEALFVKNPLVSIRVHSYNQDQYIEKCLDSILSQITNFQYEIILANNPGTDKTRDICIRYQRKHPDKIKLLLRDENVGFFANFFETGRMCKGKYIARCDADDYWCDDYKLQKQVDLLESDESIGLCHTRSYTLYENTQKMIEPKDCSYDGFKQHLLKEHILTLTVMHRKSLYDRYIDEIHPEDKDWLMEDTPISLWYSANSKIACIKDVSTVYRVLDNSISHPIDYDKKEAYSRSLRDIRIFYYNRYCDGDISLLKKINNDYYHRCMNAAYNLNLLPEYLDNFRLYQFCNLKDFSHNTISLIKLFIKILLKRPYGGWKMRKQNT